jgi:hypothetical protein
LAWRIRRGSLSGDRGVSHVRLLCGAAGEADGPPSGGLALSVLDVGVGKRLAEIGMHGFSLPLDRGTSATSMPSATIGEATDARANTQIAAAVSRSCAVRFLHRPLQSEHGI